MEERRSLREFLASKGVEPKARPAFLGKVTRIVLRPAGVIDQPISLARALYGAGLTLSEAHDAIANLAEGRTVECEVAVGDGMVSLTRDLEALGVTAEIIGDPA